MTFTDRDVHTAYRCVSELRDTRLLHGHPIPRWMHDHYQRMKSGYHATLTAAACGTENTTDRTQSDDGEIIGTQEASMILGCSTRRVRDLAADLDGVKVGRDWTFRRDAVENYREGKQQP